MATLDVVSADDLWKRNTFLPVICRLECPNTGLTLFSPHFETVDQLKNSLFVISSPHPHNVVIHWKDLAFPYENFCYRKRRLWFPLDKYLRIYPARVGAVTHPNIIWERHDVPNECSNLRRIPWGFNWRFVYPEWLTSSCSLWTSAQERFTASSVQGMNFLPSSSKNALKIVILLTASKDISALKSVVLNASTI